ncbi:MAG: hypothetical protein CMJ19_12250 [Phycisphaeraceae bacterium]|nr:hypothetical protein [Phycisphaeraceae bacterium]
MDELNTVVPASSHPKHVQLLNEQVHIDDVGDFDCKQVSIDQCDLVSDYKHPILSSMGSLACFAVAGYVLWSSQIQAVDLTSDVSHSSALAPLFLIALGGYLGYYAMRHRKRYLLKLHTQNGDVNCETSIDEMAELRSHVKLKCKC